MSTACDIAVAGHLCLDITPVFNATSARSLGDLLTPGKLVNVGPCVVSTGGPVSNTGLALITLGASAMLMGKAGDDAFGSSLCEKMRQAGAADGVITVPGEHTSYTIVVAPPGFDRVFIHCPGANDTFCAADVPYERLREVRMFHFGYPPLMKRMYHDNGAELVAMLKQARQQGVTVSLDMSLPDPESESGRVDWDTVLSRALPYVDIFVPSAEEVSFALERETFLARRDEARARGVDALDLMKPEEYSRLSSELLTRGPGVVLLKSGHRGIYARTATGGRLRAMGRAFEAQAAEAWSGRELWEPPFAVERVVSATGSGDSAIAGFLASVLRGEGIEQALRYATAAGAQNVAVADAVSGIGTFAETSARIRQGWEKSSVEIRGGGWHFIESRQLWSGPNDSRR